MSRPDLAVGAAANGVSDANGPRGPGPGGRPRRPRRFSRGTRIALIALGVLLFLAISGVLARYFSAENVEHDHEWALMQAEARGDVPGMLVQLAGCRASAACVAVVRADAAALRRPGAVEILSVQSSTNHSLTSSVGEARVAWKVAGRYPVVQCVRVQRSGNFLAGISVALLHIGPRIGDTSDC
jgi:hypothetical protein